MELTSLDTGVQHDPQNVSYVMCDTGIALYARMVPPVHSFLQSIFELPICQSGVDMLESSHLHKLMPGALQPLKSDHVLTCFAVQVCQLRLWAFQVSVLSQHQCVAVTYTPVGQWFAWLHMIVHL